MGDVKKNFATWRPICHERCMRLCQPEGMAGKDLFHSEAGNPTDRCIVLLPRVPWSHPFSRVLGILT